jgi:hypothetical protein
MAIKRKPRSDVRPGQTLTPDDPAFEAYLNKGGSVASQEAAPASKAPKKDVKFTLTIPGGLCEQLDDLRTELPIKTSRHKWVLEAILEKIQRETAT